MTFLGYEVSKVTLGNGSDKDTFQEACHALGKAVGNHDVGETTAKIQDLIMRYYTDVRGQSSESFRSAKNVALFGFILFAATIAYLVFTDVMLHLHQPWFTESEKGMGVGAIGLISGSVVELIAGTQFFLYRNSAKQFGAFHICLERTHRYLLAYTMAEQIEAKDKDKTLEKIVCIMASAPMITLRDIEGTGSGRLAPDAGTQPTYEPEDSLSHRAAT